jgi:membrane-bound metal-dependent hydrolase YbcI (DUF457 family)
MIFRTHIVFGFFLGLIVLNLGWVDNWILFLVFLFLGSGFPDVDSSKSKFGKNFLSRLVSTFSKHRRIFHSLFLGIILGYLLLRVDVGMGLGFFLGFLSHIVLDSTTKQGINFLYPFGEFKIKGWIRTGGKVEKIIFYVLVVLSVISLAKLLNLGFL